MYSILLEVIYNWLKTDFAVSMQFMQNIIFACNIDRLKLENANENKGVT